MKTKIIELTRRASWFINYPTENKYGFAWTDIYPIMDFSYSNRCKNCIILPYPIRVKLWKPIEILIPARFIRNKILKHLWLGLCKLENEILKETKNAEKSHF